MLNSLLRFVVIGVLVVAMAVGLLIAWWIALLAVLGFAGFLAVRRLLGLSTPVMMRWPPGTGMPGQGKPPGAAGHGVEPSADGAVVIEGEYVVEGEDHRSPKIAGKDGNA